MQSMTAAEIAAGLKNLSPEIPWANHFDLGHGIETVGPEADNFYRKAMGLKGMVDLYEPILRRFMNRNSFEGMRCLDIGSAEGVHTLAMAERGAKSVLGLEGRKLYVDRAEFVAKVKGVQNIEFRQADVRTLDAKALGEHDFVLCSGLLHHLNADAFLDFTKLLYDVTGDTLMLYTHVSSEWVVKKFQLQPAEPVGGRFEGSSFREHTDNASEAERTAQVRASLDNTFSFWATEPSLMQRFAELGFKTIVKLYQPSFAQTWKERVFRGIWVLRREGL